MSLHDDRPPDLTFHCSLPEVKVKGKVRDRFLRRTALGMTAVVDFVLLDRHSDNTYIRRKRVYPHLYARVF